MIERILQIIEYKGISKNQFYKETGLSNGFLDKVKDIGVSKLEQILKTYPEINPEFIIFGNKPMIKKEETSSNMVSEAQTSYEKKSNENEIIAMQKKLLESQAREIELLHEKIERLEDIKSISTKTT